MATPVEFLSQEMFSRSSRKIVSNFKSMILKIMSIAAFVLVFSDPETLGEILVPDLKESRNLIRKLSRSNKVVENTVCIYWITIRLFFALVYFTTIIYILGIHKLSAIRQMHTVYRRIA
ncbi:uncharacterized protein EV154DRAFT_552428 [Mucor mucedo]|uniref:uncharacterized protein n=1 Tax=Mucor mucedo TaxID=29922 RepID=UPI00221E4BC5|nr:uncharacterized protein EV154DRAFT_552428 [Mucor mucedo]KAI7890246.1 hypothetical protein EV154DRAFT_552428 [Mucor mucedo]